MEFWLKQLAMTTAKIGDGEMAETVKRRQKLLKQLEVLESQLMQDKLVETVFLKISKTKNKQTKNVAKIDKLNRIEITMQLQCYVRCEYI